MTNALVLLLFGCIGFVGSRVARRPVPAARAASVARSLGGSLGTRRGLSGPELQRACFSEMVRHVRVTRAGRPHAPARYVLCLHPDDLAVVDESRRWFTTGLVDALTEAARENSWVLEGAVHIGYDPDPSRRPGAPSAMATRPEDPEGTKVGPPPAARPQAAPTSRGLALLRSDTGERIELSAGVVTIGRARDRAITIDDTQVSRVHAHVEPRKGRWAMFDSGSANGTKVNGQELPRNRPCPLRVGDVITVGPVDLTVVAGEATSGPAGTRALDDHERTRISGEVLPRRST